jgi:DTW domain-containing protein YfiP
MARASDLDPEPRPGARGNGTRYSRRMRCAPSPARRCPRCFFPSTDCLCPDIRRFSTRTRFLVLRHASERNRPSNSGRWAALALTRSRILDYALPGPLPDLSALEEPGTALLFPSPHGSRPSAPPRQVVVLDATWAQARRMSQRIPALRTLPRLALPAQVGPRLADPLRRPTIAGGLSTIEAIAGALELLGETEAAQALAALNAAALGRAWRLRGGCRCA